MSIEAVKAAIRTTLLADAGLRQIMPSENRFLLHAGKFTWAELKARSFNAPAVFISHLGFKAASEDKRAEFAEDCAVFNVRFAIGIAAKHAKTIEARNLIAATIAERIALIANDNQTWDLATVDNNIERLEAQGLFVLEAEQDGHSMWLVTFYQHVQIDSTDFSGLDIFEGFDADHLLDGDVPDAGDELQTQDDYPE
jgi:hypothetical protein